MTREQFNSQMWRNGMRCFIEIRIQDETKRHYGTIRSVMFNSSKLGILLDGKDVIEKIPCERVTLISNNKE